MQERETIMKLSTSRVVSPVGRGFLLLESHPTGCFRSVDLMRAEVPVPDKSPARRPTALVIGSSAGYGLASTVAGLVRYGINGVGVSFERPSGRRTASAGWYRTIATDRIAHELGSDFVFRNADAFADTTKTETLELVDKRFGGIDYLIYSVAAPRRTDPRTGITYHSAIKPREMPYATRNVKISADGAASLHEVTIAPATEAETAATVQVMGGEDWSRWVSALAGRDLLRDGFRTVALSYVGSPLTSAIYRRGTMGAAKTDLESAAVAMTEQLAVIGGHAYASVNGAAVTQALTAIPGVPLYVSVLRNVLGDRFPSLVDQSVQLWDQLISTRPDVDESGRIRLDQWELSESVQAAVTERWLSMTAETLTEHADVTWFRTQFHSLYGFEIPGIDYDIPVETDLPWPDPA